MKKLSFIILFFIANYSFAQQEYDFAIYHDNNIGAWEDGIVAFEQFLNWKEISHNRVTAQDINTIDLKDYYKVICFPGGDADYFNADINPTGIQHIKDLINNDGGYIGFCAGAEFACDKLVWEGVTYDYPLDLFQGKSIGPIDDIAVWPSYDMATLSMNLENEINQFEPPKEDILYWGGSIFEPYSGTTFNTVATFDDYYDYPAIINFNYGEGRVLLLSPHPEIEENDDRDNVNVAEELDDLGTDWNFLWAATDWLLGNQITDATLSNPDFSINPEVIIYPIPTSKAIFIKFPEIYNLNASFSIFDYLGRNILTKKIYLNTDLISINVGKFSNGIYILKMFITEEVVLNKKIIISR